MMDLTNKIGSLFVQSTAGALFDETKISDSEMMDKVIKSIKDALKAAHKVATANFDASPLQKMLSDYRRDEAIQLLDIKLRKHKDVINMFTPLTNRYVEFMQNPYDNKTNEEIKVDIRFTIFIIYMKAAKDAALGKALTEVIRKIIRIVKNDNSAEGEDDICRQIQRSLGLKL